MNFLTSSFLIVTFGAPNFAVGNHIKLSAVSDIPYLEQLYRRVRSKDLPLETDPATIDDAVHIRQSICEDITNSGFFKWYALSSVSWSDALEEPKKPQYSDVFHQIFTQSEGHEDEYNYTNRYTVQKFEVLSAANEDFYKTTEHVFVCLLKYWLSEDLIPYYVSKEYNVSVDPENGFRAGRFIFGERRRIILAEESAQIVPIVDVELHYLQMRKDHQLAESFELDPVCKLVTKEAQVNQHYRLCVIVLTSPDLRVIFDYPARVNAYSILEDYISFKTETLHGQVYQERIVICPVRIAGSPQQSRVYISRAYKSGEVFIHFRDPRDGKLYVKNLARNVDIVQEPSIKDYSIGNTELK